jgi:hypothetical protein
MILSDAADDKLADVISDALTTLKEKSGVYSFNISIVLKPLIKTPEVWDHLPIITRIVDRGRLTEKTADVSAMEFYGQSIIASNPYDVFNNLKTAMVKGEPTHT